MSPEFEIPIEAEAVKPLLYTSRFVFENDDDASLSIVFLRRVGLIAGQILVEKSGYEIPQDVSIQAQSLLNEKGYKFTMDGEQSNAKRFKRSEPSAPPLTLAEASSTLPRSSKSLKTPFYNLDRYSKYRDPIMVAGFGLVLIAVARISPVAAVMLLGAGMMYVGWLMSR